MNEEGSGVDRNDGLKPLVRLRGATHEDRQLIARVMIHQWWAQAAYGFIAAFAFVGFFAVTCPAVCG